MSSADEGLAPARRQRSAPGPGAPSASESVEAELARGQAAAVLGALGRMQLRLDLMAREQTETLARIEARLDALDARLDGRG